MEKLQPRYKPAQYEVVCLGIIESGRYIMVFPSGQRSEPFTAQVIQVKETKQWDNPMVRVRRGSHKFWLGGGTSVSIMGSPRILDVVTQPQS